MKPVSQAYIDAWHQKNGKQGLLYVQFKRRYWNEGSAQFVYESSWTQYTMRQFVEVGTITYKLDTPLRNQFKASSVSLRFKNSDYQFLPTNSTSGIFAPNATTVAAQPANPARGFEPMLTKFQILFGYKLASGSIETTALFTGVMGNDPIFNPEQGYVDVVVSGNEFLLQSNPANTISNALTAAPTTNTSGLIYVTNSANIAFITNVYDNGVKKVQGSDYLISGTGTYGSGATITMLYSPAGAITYDGAQWKTLAKIEDLVTSIATACGISSYNINPVIFPGGSGAVLTNIGQFSGSSYSPTWTRLDTTTSSVSAAGGVLTLTGKDNPPTTGPISMSTASTSNTGVWSFLLNFAANGITTCYVHFMNASNAVTSPWAFPFLTGNGYHLSIFSTSCQLVRSDGTILFNNSVPAGLGSFLGSHTWVITRNGSGSFGVYCDGFLIGTANDNTYSTSNFFQVTAYGAIVSISNITNQQAVLLTMANFSNMSCYDAVQKLAKLADYEWGFNSDGVMFFRSKTPANKTAVVTLSQSDGISQMLEFRPGYNEVINDAQVTYGAYYREYNSSTAPETAPTSQQRFLTQLETEDYTDFLLAYDPIIAAGRAQSLHDNNYLPKRRARIKTKIIPFLELSDVSSYSYYNNPRNVDNIFGDPLEKWGTSTFSIPMDVLARNIPGKVTSLVMNPNDCTGELILEEVI